MKVKARAAAAAVLLVLVGRRGIERRGRHPISEQLRLQVPFHP